MIINIQCKTRVKISFMGIQIQGIFQAWLYIVLLTLIKTCVGYQGPGVTTGAPAPHRGAARQMYGSGSLRPPGSKPAVYGPGQRPQSSRSSPSPPALPPKVNTRFYPFPYPVVPISIPIGDFIPMPENFPRIEYTGRDMTRGSARSSNPGGAYGGRLDNYKGKPTYTGMSRGRRPGSIGGDPDRGSSGYIYGVPNPIDHGVQVMIPNPNQDVFGMDGEHPCAQNCKEHEFLCISSCTCIENIYRCDAVADCDQHEDEMECGETNESRNAKCRETDARFVRCPRSGKCILKDWLCDGDDDCGDYSDETHCGGTTNCTIDQFECANGLCIPKSWICDNDNDCKDFSDELNCTKSGCTKDEFTCADGSCISMSWKCDRDPDCSDGSDETECDVVPPLCGKSEFQCTYQKCIVKEFRCDGDNDCGDWSDEDTCNQSKTVCEKGEYRCNSGKCIPANWICDKQQDCEDNEDEKNCTDVKPRTCHSDEFLCRSGTCILKNWVCDGVSDCAENEDESQCEIVCDDTKFACLDKNPNSTTVEFCINKKHVCDGQNDCPKGEDETDCPTRHDCSENSNCSQVCVTYTNGKEGCTCLPGYNLAKDGITCEDINECLYETDPVCSQTCNNTIGSFTCGCMTGYILRPDLRSCKALGAPPTLLFANRVDIRQISISNSKYTALLKGLHNAIALDYHYKLGLIFWSDVSMDVIKCAYVNGTGVTDIIKWGLESPGGVALDWVHDLIFWTDSGTQRVEVANLDGTQRAIIVPNDLDKPRAIVVHPGEAYIFWTDWGPNPKIERVEMDGSNRKSIVTESVFWPNGLALDYTNNRIYWADAKHNVIETALYDGSERRKVISKGLPHPFALTIFEDAIYWTDWHTKAISTANKATGAGLRIIHSNLHFPMDIHSYHPQRQPNYKNHCGANNGGCENLCLPNKKSYTCVCRMGQKLKADRKSCQTPDKLLVFARKKDLRIKHLDEDAATHNEIVIPIDSIKEAVAIAWDSKTDTIFWTDVERNTISKAHWNGSNQQVIIKDNLVTPAGVAYDWLTDKIYWTDSETARIEVAMSNGSLRGLLIWEGLDKPRDIVVDPTAGYMYWSSWGDRPKIERAAMDGSQRTIVVMHNLTWPNGLAIDHITNRLYWTDGGGSFIGYSNLDGGNRKVLLESAVTVPNPFGLDVFGDTIYWTDWKTLNIEMVNKLTGQNRTVVSSGISDLMDVRVFHRNRKYKNTPCHNNNGGCSHLCLLKPKGHACACPIGITLQPDGKTCTNGPINSLILAHRVDIRQISLDVPYLVDVVLPFPPLKNAISVDVDRKTGEIFWTDTATDTIQKNTLDGKSMRTVIRHEMEMADGIAIDSTGRKMYWTDGDRQSIEVAELNGSNRKVLIWKDIENPRAIALHYHHGLMFWSDWGKRAKIECAQMDGSQRKAIITTNLEWPNGLAIDRAGSRLYWSDGKKCRIESSDLNGRDRRVILSAVPHPYGLVVVGNHIYWTDWQTESLHRAEKINGTDATVIRNKLQGLMDVRSVQNDNIAENACGDNNGGCSHLCLRNVVGYSCACPTGIKLKKGSSKECDYQPSNYLLFATNAALARISLDTDEMWEVTLPIRRLQHVVDVDFHWEKQLIIITDVEREKIQGINMRNLSEKFDIITLNQTSPNGVTVDWISDIIYWTDAGSKVIEAAKIDGTMRKTVIRNGLTEPRAIACYPRKGYLYWSDWGGKAKIERSYLDGSGRQVIVNKDLGFPNGLVLDFKAKRLYWTDSKDDRIETSDLHGKNRLQLLHSSSQFTFHPFGLTVFDEYIYWTGWHENSIMRAEKSSGKNMVVIKQKLEGALGVTTVSESRQKGWTPCAVNNGGCTHLCFFKQTNYTCECPDLPTDTPCKTEPKAWVPITHPDSKYEYFDEESDDSYYNTIEDNDLAEYPNAELTSNLMYVLIFAPITCTLLVVVVAIAACLLYKQTKKKYLYATGRNVMTFSNPNYYTSNPETTSGPVSNAADKKPFLWKRLKYDKSQERVYEEKGGLSSPEVTSLIPAVLTPSSSNCEAVTPELERSPSITPLHRVNSLTTVA